MYSHSNSFGNNAEKNTAGCRAFDRKYIVIGGACVPIRYKLDVLAALKERGFTTYKIRKEKLLSESTVQKLRKREPLAWENIETLCRLLQCQPGDIVEYVPDEAGD